MEFGIGRSGDTFYANQHLPNFKVAMVPDLHVARISEQINGRNYILVRTTAKFNFILRAGC